MTRPQVNPGTSVARAWVGGMSLDSLSEGIRLNQTGSTQQSVDTQRFWSTPSRDAEDTTREVMQITLATARRLNEIEFDVAAFPQDVYAEFYDAETRAWTPCLDDLSPSPDQVAYGVRDSVPTVLPPASAVLGHLHPQHSFTGHWRTVTFQIRPVYTKLLRLVLSRTTEGTAPTNTQRVKVPYSLAVRNLRLSYSIRKLSDVPWTSPAQGEMRDTFATTTDLFGSVVDFQVRVNSATNAIGTTTGANGLTTVWKSEPQPIPWAVVNYYCDIRDLDGNGQVIDRFFLDPIYEGPTCNLYWSDSEPTARFRSNSDPIPPVVAMPNNSAGVSGNVLNFSDPAFADAIAFVELRNEGIAFDPSRPWSLGGQMNLKYRHGTQNEDHPIFDCGAFTLTWTPLGPRLTTGAGDSLLVPTQTAHPGIVTDSVDVDGNPIFTNAGDPVFVGFDPATPLNFIAWSDTETIGVAIRFGTIEFAGTLPLSTVLGSAARMRVGAFLGDAPGTFKARLQGLILKTDVSPTPEEVEDFLRDPMPYILNSVYLGQNDPRTDNALLRYHPSLYTSDFPSAFVGGAPDRYAFMDWHPVARDYVLRKGYLYFPPTRAKYWKFEFTNLSAQSYEVFRPVDQTVNVFPSEQWRKAVAQNSRPSTSSGLGELLPGRDNIYVVNTLSQTLDNGRSAVVGTGAAKSNTTARVIYDSDVRSRVSDVYWAWSFLPTHATGVTPSWESTGRHNYQVINYKQTKKLAYFVGLRAIQAFKLNYLNTDDTNQYVELFHDLSNVADGGNWLLSQDHLLTSGGAPYAEVRGKTFPSNRVVTAVQFATQQSEPIQLLPDADLDDATMSSWDAVGDAVLDDSSGSEPTLATTKRISRSQPPLTWARVVKGYPTWGTPPSLNATWDAMKSGSQIPGESGGISSKAITLPLGGRVHVAARATSDVDLSLPLSVQIVDADSDRVLADADIAVKSGQIAEWYASYTIGEGTDPVPWIWRDFASGYSSNGMNTSFTAANATTLPPFDTGQTWNWPIDGSGNEQSLDIVSNKAQVTADGQRDWVDTGSPWGTFQVTVGTMGTPAHSSIALLRLDPFFILDNGALGLRSGAGLAPIRGLVLGANNTVYNVVPGDTIRIDFLPADYVPADKLDPTGNSLDQYAMMFWVNGVWKSTRTHNYGQPQTRGIKGRLGQQFTKVNWTPASYGRIAGQSIQGMPRRYNGAWLDSTTQQTWKDEAGRLWYVASSNPTATPTASWDTTNDPEFASRDDVGTTLVASTDNAVMWTDVGHWNGNMTFYLRNIARTAGLTDPNGRLGLVACLDFDAGIYLDAQGNVVQGAATLQTGLFPGGLPLNANITLVFADAKLFDPGSTAGRQVYAVVENQTVGTMASSVTTLLTGTKRGLAGGLWSGTRPGGANYTLDTSFQSFNWSPNAKQISADVLHPTWGSATRNGSITYGEVLREKDTASLRVKARVVQQGASTDDWDIDNISLYADPIVWSFSNDGGYTFTPAYEIRNNPSGVLVFPQINAINLVQKPGNALVWRAISYRPGSIISSLVIRPWYGGMFSGIDHRQALVAVSPNIMPYDQYGDIRKDARFQTWNLPIPRSWWYQFQVIERIPTTGPGVNPVPVSVGWPGEDVFPGDNVYPGVPS
jgi:hypothetical protein